MQEQLIRKLPVKSQMGDYEVIIGSNLLKQVDEYLAAVVETSAPLLLVYDEALVPFGYPERVKATLLRRFPLVATVVVPSGEHSKSFAMAEKIYQVAIREGLDRKTVFLALGGGVVGDLTGFVAATYMRGVRFVQLPTTLLAHDSSIGGKVAINLPEGKNLVGAFHAPKLVLYDVDLLRSLPTREIASGLAEAIKHGVIASPELFSFLSENAEDLLNIRDEKMIELLYQSCLVKANVVSQDEHETGLRAILNFGHTVGHALETLNYGFYTHGEAVAMGMMVELEISILMDLADVTMKDQLRNLLQRSHLPYSIEQHAKSADVLIDLMRRDKKAELRSLAFILPTAIGHVQIMKNVPEEIVRKALLS